MFSYFQEEEEKTPKAVGSSLSRDMASSLSQPAQSLLQEFRGSAPVAPKGVSGQDLLIRSLAAAAPILLGKAFGGDLGAASGANASAAFTGALAQQDAQKQAEYEQALAKYRDPEKLLDLMEFDTKFRGKGLDVAKDDYVSVLQEQGYPVQKGQSVSEIKDIVNAVNKKRGIDIQADFAETGKINAGINRQRLGLAQQAYSADKSGVQEEPETLTIRGIQLDPKKFSGLSDKESSKLLQKLTYDPEVVAFDSLTKNLNDTSKLAMSLNTSDPAQTQELMMALAGNLVQIKEGFNLGAALSENEYKQFLAPFRISYTTWRNGSAENILREIQQNMDSVSIPDLLNAMERVFNSRMKRRVESLGGVFKKGASEMGSEINTNSSQDDITNELLDEMGY